jgi:hypothetical protein
MVNRWNRPTPIHGVGAQSLGEELVIFDPSGAPTYVANQTGAEIWLQLDG